MNRFFLYQRGVLALALVFLCVFVSQGQDTLAKGTPFFRLEGNLFLQTGFYQVQGIRAREPNFPYLLQCNASAYLGQVELPFTVIYSNFQRDFRQPFNQFGISPRYKSLTVHLGFRNPVLSQFTYAGHTALGAGLEWNPGKFRFAIFSGRTQKAVTQDTGKVIPVVLNDISYPAYRRWVNTVKIGVGTANNFIDLIVVQGKDDSTSLQLKTEEFDLQPAENTVGALHSKITVFDRRLQWENEVALSVYTRDSRIANEFEELERYQKYMALNASTIYNRAAESKLDWNDKTYGLGLKYRLVDPDYKSMGAYFFQSDMEQFLGHFRLAVLNQQLQVTGSGGLQTDNTNNKKAATTRRSIYSGTVSYNPSFKFGMDFQFSNFGTSQRDGRVTLSDTLRINQINRFVAGTLRFSKMDTAILQQWMLMGGYQTLIDNNRFSATFNTLDMYYANLIYTRDFIASDRSLNTALNYSLSKTVAGDILLAGLSAGMTQRYPKSGWTLDGNLALNATAFNAIYNGLLANVQLSTQYRPSRKHTFGASLQYNKNISRNEDAGASFDEFIFRINYNYQF